MKTPQIPALAGMTPLGMNQRPNALQIERAKIAAMRDDSPEQEHAVIAFERAHGIRYFEERNETASAKEEGARHTPGQWISDISPNPAPSCWVRTPDAKGNLVIITAVNAHAGNEARIAELEAALRGAEDVLTRAGLRGLHADLAVDASHAAWHARAALAKGGTP